MTTTTRRRSVGGGPGADLWAAEAAVVVVAQRISTIRDADQIVVLDEGTVAGIGRHEELMQDCPTYSEIVLSQLTEAEATR